MFLIACEGKRAGSRENVEAALRTYYTRQAPEVCLPRELSLPGTYYANQLAAAPEDDEVIAGLVKLGYVEATPTAGVTGARLTLTQEGEAHFTPDKGFCVARAEFEQLEKVGSVTTTGDSKTLTALATDRMTLEGWARAEPVQRQLAVVRQVADKTQRRQFTLRLGDDGWSVVQRVP